MIGIVIVAHGGLATEYLAAVEHVVGPQARMCAIAVAIGDDRAAKQAEICAACDRVDAGQGVVVVTDIFGGSPSNLALLACSKRRRAILYGANLPMLIKLCKSRHLALSEAVVAARDAGRRYIDSFEVGAEARPGDTTAASRAPLPPCAVEPIRPAAEAPHRGELAAPRRRPRGRNSRAGFGKLAT